MNDGFLALVSWTILVSMFGFYMGSVSTQREAVKTECAKYNAISGDFEWILEQKANYDK